MPIEILYYDIKIQKTLSTYESVCRVLKNQKLSLRTMNIMRTLSVANNLYDVALISGIRLHPLIEKLKGLYALDVPNKKSGYRIVFIPLNGDDISQEIINTIPPNPKLKTINKIKIIDRCDYHTRPNKVNLEKILKRL